MRCSRAAILTLTHDFCARDHKVGQDNFAAIAPISGDRLKLRPAGQAANRVSGKRIERVSFSVMQGIKTDQPPVNGRPVDSDNQAVPSEALAPTPADTMAG